MIKNKNFIKLFLATFITRFGDSLDNIAFSWYVYILTGSKLLMGSIFAVNLLPNLILLPFGGILADRFSKKKLIISGDVGRGISVVIISILIHFKIADVWHLFAFTIINSCFESLANPARSSLLPSLVSKNQLSSANGYLSSAQTAGNLTGLAGAGVFIAAIGVGGALLIDAATFFLSAIIIAIIKIKHKLPVTQTENNKENPFKSIIDGIKTINTLPLVLSMIFFTAFLNFSLVPYNVLKPVYVDEILKMGAEGMSYTGIALLLGMFLGGLVVGKVGDYLKTVPSITIGTILVSLSYAGLGGIVYFNINNTTILILSLILSFVFGFFIPFISAPLNTHIMKIVPEDKMGRIFSIISMFALAATPLGGFIIGIIGEYFKVEDIFITMGFFGISVALLFMINAVYKEKKINYNNKPCQTNTQET